MSFSNGYVVQTYATISGHYAGQAVLAGISTPVKKVLLSSCPCWWHL